MTWGVQKNRNWDHHSWKNLDLGIATRSQAQIFDNFPSYIIKTWLHAQHTRRMGSLTTRLLFNTLKVRSSNNTIHYLHSVTSNYTGMDLLSCSEAEPFIFSVFSEQEVLANWSITSHHAMSTFVSRNRFAAYSGRPLIATSLLTAGRSKSPISRIRWTVHGDAIF